MWHVQYNIVPIGQIRLYEIMRRFIPMLAILCLVVITVVAMLPATQTWVVYPNEDSSIFMYIGNVIRAGQLPYVDVWDNKPPAIYYTNALALTISNGAWWGLWLVMTAFSFVTGLVSFILVRKHFGNIAAWLSSILLLVQFLDLNLDGNFTEQYALLFMFIALWRFAPLQQITRYDALILGLTGAASFLYRQNLIGVWLVIGLYWTIELLLTRNWRKYGQIVGLAVVSGITPLLLVGAYFAAQGAFTTMWESIFVFNAAYSKFFTLPAEEMRFFLVYGFVNMGETIFGIRVFMLLPILWVISLIYVITQRKLENHQRALIIIGLVLLPLEIFLTSVSAEGFHHYYLVWLPPMVLLIGGTITAIQAWVMPLADLEKRPLIVAAIGLVVITISLLPIALEYFERRETYLQRLEQAAITQAANYIEGHIQPDDTVVIWGYEVAILNNIQQTPTSRFVHPFALTKSGYDTAPVIEEMFNALKQEQPAIIVDTNDPSVPPLHLDNPANWQGRTGYEWYDELAQMIAYIQENYQLFYVTETEDWFIYRSYASMGQ